MGCDKERECNCCIEIEESIVVILCGDVEIDKFRNTLDTAIELKGKKQ